LIGFPCVYFSIIFIYDFGNQLNNAYTVFLASGWRVGFPKFISLRYYEH
jgi:hypothetical protein